MEKLGASEVAALLVEYGRRSALRGGNPYRAKAYIKAAENLSGLSEPLERVIAEGRLTELPGVGVSIADIITKLHQNGTHPSLEKMRSEVPDGVLEMLCIPGLRPDKVLKLHQVLGINSIDELERAARADRLKPIKGLGAALQRKILQGLEIRRTTKGARHIHRAAQLLKLAEQNLRQSAPDLTRVQPVGDFRRGTELVSDLSLIAQTANKARPTIIRHGEFSVHLTDRARFGITQLLATGSAAHLDQLRTFATERGMELTRDGLRGGKKILAAASEQEIYKALGLPFIPPELREGRDEVRLVSQNGIPALVTDESLRGILHAHTDRSDGANTLKEMANAALKRGYDYFGVADHSKSAHYAGGLSVEEILEQHAEVDRLNKAFGGQFKIFKGIESDILTDGSLDYPDKILKRFDFVVASVHSQFAKDKEAQTRRIIRAVSHPAVTILGHMTGRQLLRRPGYEVDVERILSACAKHAVAIEINANPWRLDLDWRWHQRALELGCVISINPDAHSTAEFDLVHWGVVMARKGGVPANRVINAMELRAFERFLSQRRLGQRGAAA